MTKTDHLFSLSRAMECFSASQAISLLASSTWQERERVRERERERESEGRVREMERTRYFLWYLLFCPLSHASLQTRVHDELASW